MPQCRLPLIWALRSPSLIEFFVCIQAVLTKHVNLVNLVQGDKMEVQIFETERDLSKYTKRTKKFFPKEDAVDRGVLCALCHCIFLPRGPASKGDLDEPDSSSIADLF